MSNQNHNGLIVRKAVDRYLDDMRERELSDDYIRVTRIYLSHFVEGRGGRPISAISRGDLQEHLRGKAASRSESTMEKYKQVHRTFWRFCAEQGWIDEDISRPRDWEWPPQPYRFAEELPEEPELVGQAMALYLDDMRERGLSKAHIKTTRSTLKIFAEAHGDRRLDEITRRVLHEHFHALGQTRVEATLASMRARHKSFWRFCREQGWIEENLADNLKRYSFDPATPRAAPEEHVQAVVDKLPAFVEGRCPDPRDVRDALFVSLSIDSGARRGEIVNLRRSKVERALQCGEAETQNPIHTVESKGKTGTAVLRFTSDTAELFRQWFTLVDEELPAGQAEDRVFLSVRSGRPMHPDSIGNSAFERLCNYAGVPVFKSHAVRHRNITAIIEATGDPKVAQLVAGHSGLDVTLRIYNEALERHAVEATAALASRRRQQNGQDGAGPEANGDLMAKLVRLQGEFQQVLAQLKGQPP